MGTTTDERAAGISDDAVKAKTGKAWAEWFAIMDEGGMKGKSHREIVKFLTENHGIGPWWRQMMTVQYERARGQREVFQSCDGVFRANVSKTIAAPVETLFDAWNDPSIRLKWLDEAIVVRKATHPKSLRITWSDGKTSVEANLYSKGEGKSAVNVEHTKLADAADVAAKKAYWGETLGHLKTLLEG